MFVSKASLAALALASTTLAQQSNITIPATNGSLPAATGSNGCAAGYEPGNNTMAFTLPYTYSQVLSVIGNYTNLTWAGSPDNSVTTNVSSALANNTWAPGDARTYELLGATLIETILTYDKPANGPYVEIHTLAPLTLALPDGNLSTYAAYDGQRWESTCDGRATVTNFTVEFCATNATVAKGVFDMVHRQSAVTVGQFLGGMNFTTCEALASMNGTNGDCVDERN